MLLDDKHAIIYGAAGSIGRAVALGLAREGATVHLTGRHQGKLDAVAADVRELGGASTTALVDALDETQVQQHADAVASKNGRIDITFNAIGLGDVQGTPLAEMSLEDYERPIVTATRTMFLTTRAAARHMIRQRSGVMLFFGGDDGHEPIRDYDIGGFQIALGVVDSLRRQLAAELGRYGVRAVTLQTAGIGESIPHDFEGRTDLLEMLTEPTMLKRLATLEDVGNAAAFVASDKAAAITAASINITAGAVAD